MSIKKGALQGGPSVSPLQESSLKFLNATHPCVYKNITTITHFCIERRKCCAKIKGRVKGRKGIRKGGRDNGKRERGGRVDPGIIFVYASHISLYLSRISK